MEPEILALLIVCGWEPGTNDEWWEIWQKGKLRFYTFKAPRQSVCKYKLYEGSTMLWWSSKPLTMIKYLQGKENDTKRT